MRKRFSVKDNIEILYNTNTLGLYGENGVEGAHLVRFKGEENEEKFDVAIDGFFLAIGHTPNTELFKGQLDLDDHGFILTQPKSTMRLVMWLILPTARALLLLLQVQWLLLR